MIRLGSLAGFSFEGPRLLGGCALRMRAARSEDDGDGGRTEDRNSAHDSKTPTPLTAA